MKVKKPLVLIVMGSDSDLPVMKEAAEVLEKFGVPFELRISSAHRSPDATLALAKSAEKRGIKVIIAGAGGAAHLPGVIAAMTVLPVIGVPMDTRYLSGVDSLYSIVQMPKGIPVACMAIGAGGAANAGIFAVQVISGSSEKMKKELHAYKKALDKAVREKSRILKKRGYENYGQEQK